MKQTQKIVIKKSHPDYQKIMESCHLAKNLYNASLYDIRQHWFTEKTFKTDFTQYAEFARDNNPDYRALPSKVSREVIKNVTGGFKSFLQLLRKKKSEGYDRKVKIPGYLPRGGAYQLTIPKDAISKRPRDLGGGLFLQTICGRDLGIQIKTTIEHPQMIKFIPKSDHILAMVIYNVPDQPLREDNGRYMSIDLGVNNLATVFSNTGSRATIYNGRPIKSINQWYNKKMAHLSSREEVGVRTRRMNRLTTKRSNKIDWILHNISNQIVNQAASNQIATIIIGHNKEWKQDANLGRRGNQNFVQIPFAKLIHLITYKAELRGIRTITTEESYTSKCSALDRESIQKHESYLGTRSKRGLFKTSLGQKINADVNGAINIMRKVVPDATVFGKGIEVGTVQPVKVTL